MNKESKDLDSVLSSLQLSLAALHSNNTVRLTSCVQHLSGESVPMDEDKYGTAVGLVPLLQDFAQQLADEIHTQESIISALEDTLGVADSAAGKSLPTIGS